MTNWHTSRVVEFDDDDATSVQAARLAIKHLDFAFLQDKRIEIQQCECKWGWKRRCTRGMPPTGPFDGAMYRQLTAVVASVFARLQMGVMTVAPTPLSVSSAARLQLMRLRRLARAQLYDTRTHIIITTSSLPSDPPSVVAPLARSFRRSEIGITATEGT